MTTSTETEVIALDAATIEVRYYDDGRPGKCRCWKIPLHEARDIARWWAERGSRIEPDGRLSSEQRFGSVLVRLMSASQVHARRCDTRGRPAITGYQLPRDAVALLSDWLAEWDAATDDAKDMAREGYADLHCNR